MKILLWSLAMSIFSMMCKTQTAVVSTIFKCCNVVCVLIRIDDPARGWKSDQSVEIIEHICGTYVKDFWKTNDLL